MHGKSVLAIQIRWLFLEVLSCPFAFPDARLIYIAALGQPHIFRTWISCNCFLFYGSSAYNSSLPKAIPQQLITLSRIIKQELPTFSIIGISSRVRIQLMDWWSKIWNLENTWLMVGISVNLLLQAPVSFTLAAAPRILESTLRVLSQMAEIAFVFNRRTRTITSSLSPILIMSQARNIP